MTIAAATAIGFSLGSASMTEPPEASSYTQEQLWNLVSKSGETLTSEQQHELYNLLLEFADVFTSNEDGLRRTKVLQHAISTGNTPPIWQPPRRAPPIQKETIRNLLVKMLSKDIIKHSKSPWASPGKEKRWLNTILHGLPQVECCHGKRCLPTATH